MNAQTQAVTAEQNKAPTLQGELDVLRPQLEKVLPQHVSAEKFMRVVMTAIAQSPDLRNAERSSLLTSCVKCATDGLLPDGREAALVIFISKGVKKVQYMPMVGGILKKVRNSGELLSITSVVVHEKDTFRRWIDDVGEHITFEENLRDPDRGQMLCVFAIAKTKDGGVYIEVMSRGQIEQVKAISKSGNNGPWGPWYSEMARKTVIRRLSKRLPMSTDLEAVIHRDDELYDLKQERITAGSGRDATRAVLGLPILPDSDDAAAAGVTDDDEPGEADNGVENVDKTTGEIRQTSLPEASRDDPYTATAVKMLQDARDKAELSKAWKEIRAEYKAKNLAPPLDVESIYTDRLDEIK